MNKDRAYMIGQIELLLRENKAAKEKLLELIGEENTLKLI